MSVRFAGSGTPRPTGFKWTPPQTVIRDPKYYFEDGSTIFRVGEYLFKIQRSLLSSQSKVFDGMFSLPTPNEPGSSADVEGASDTNPITIPDVQADQFRHLLLFFYGNMADPDYRSLVLHVPDERVLNQAAFKRYLDIARLAHRFCMDSVETWALGQFKRVTQSYTRATAPPLNPTNLFDALAYSKLTADRELESDIRNLARCYISSLSHVPLPTPNTNQIKVSILTRVYEDAALKQQDPALFGYIFCVVLSAGHESPVWKALTRDDRSKLLAAQVYLTPLPCTLPIGWIQNPSEIFAAVDVQSRQICFHNCSQIFIRRFCQLANRPDFINDSPLVGVAALSKLATHRQSIAKEFKLSA
ncbi:hypothetical protein FRC06_011710, partial [Ceratobasidium sp. 370]